MSRADDLLLTLPDSDLPRSMQELSGLGIDRRSILALCRVYGGRILHVRHKEPGELEKLIGAENGRRLWEHFHGSAVEIPSLFCLRAKARAATVVEMRNQDRKISDIAMETGLSMRRIRSIMKAHRRSTNMPPTQERSHETH